MFGLGRGMRRACLHARGVVPPGHGWAVGGLRAFATARQLAEMEEEVLDVLRKVDIDNGGKNVVSMGIVKNVRIDPDNGSLRLSIVSADANVRLACEQAVAQARLPWLTQRPVIDVGDVSSSEAMGSVDGTEGVKRIIAVSSCKGGVGKSTVAVNLALALKEKGKKVGLLDTDVYGPSLPTMMVEKGTEWAVTRSTDLQMINPVSLHGVKCMSYGFVAPGTGGKSSGSNSTSAAVLRGPIVSNIVTQLALKTFWGELDYLVLDLPPGTGDIQLTLGQQMCIDGAVIVTTPQTLSFVDVVKGIEMFDKLKVPTISVVENMAWFDGDDGKRYMPFGPGHREELVKRYGIKNSFTLPILQNASSSGDCGKPFFENYIKSEAADVYRDIASAVDSQLSAESENSEWSTSRVKVRFDKQRRAIVARFLGESDAKEFVVSPLEFRKHIRKVDDMLGLEVGELDETLEPLEITPVGNYAISIKWNDGHDTSIYPYTDIYNMLIKMGEQD
mmetsp:Transcript_27209/g.43740  ORF Transcript_27209/g.43740 Transcript_27209/m.43740 type:complete len:502 (+) Transcript_27209:774-2279(+)